MKIEKSLEERIIDKLATLPGKEFTEVNFNDSYSPYGQDSGSSTGSGFKYFDSESGQMFSIVRSDWVSYWTTLSGETETERGVNYYLRVYDYRGDKQYCRKVFELSGEKAERLYCTVQRKVSTYNRKEEEEETRKSKEKLKKFAGRKNITKS